MNKLDNKKLTATGERKESHLNLALDSQNRITDPRFYYEPMLAGHPCATDTMPTRIGEKELRFPIWISSMTGGTAKAGPINRMLAKTARKFGLGMGLGSCRIILDDSTYFEDFNLRPELGDSCPLFANIGIAQVENLLDENKAKTLDHLVSRLDADGLIIHVNPLQEWLQPEGDPIRQPPIETIKRVLNEVSSRLIVKEVGQGFGPQSMRALLQLPLLAIDFGANGGTNFSKLELKRNQEADASMEGLVSIGHSAEDMVCMLNELVDERELTILCEQVIISGGVKTYLDGYFLTQKARMPAIYGQAAPFLEKAYISQEALDSYARCQTEGLLLARQLLTVK